MQLGMITADSTVKLASFPGHSQILSSSYGEKSGFSPQLLDKIWEWPGNEATVKHDSWQSTCSSQNVVSPL